MSSFVVDSSALLAFLNSEPGAEVVQPLLPSATISSVNLAEVLTRLVDRHASNLEMAWNRIGGVIPEVSDFDTDLARRTAELRPATRRLGLSLGDRACLALAARSGLPALTADRAWLDIDVGVEIRLIRQ